ncbi:hypothetical protein [Microbacterium sp. zg-YB36]|uniref:hypothetical protein n=1 Tax=Microbacterium sp. zg-YB36 TaxID=2969407 RepID=UPI00214C4DD8|nr:hypothetical protein [Microbacterium sp. zg-YB36]MDL5352327.1 hypothetical protein [Microbacterium sp. zg-YB36]
MATFPFTAIAAFASAALIIGYAGPTSYAAMSVVITLSQLVPYADLGVGAGVINAVSTARPGDDSGRRAAASAVRLLLLSGAAIVIIGVAVAALVGWPSVLSLDDQNLAGLPEAILGVILLIGVTVPLGIGQRILTGLFLNPTAIAISAVGPMLGLIGTASIVGAGLPPVFLVFPPVLGSAAAALIASMLAFRRISFRAADVFRVKSFGSPGLLRIGLWYLLLSIASASAFQSGRLVLAHTSSLEILAQFAITMQVYSPVWSFFAAGGTALWPIFSRRRMQNRASSPLFFRMTVIFASAGVLCAACLVALGPWVAAVLSQGTIDTGRLVFLACGILIVAQSFQLVQGVFLTSQRGIRHQALWSLPLAVTVIPLALVWSVPAGAAAPFIAAATGVTLFQIVPNFIRIRRQGARSNESD